MAVLELQAQATKIIKATQLAIDKGGILLAYSLNDVVLVDLKRGVMPYVTWLYDTYSNSFISGTYSTTLDNAKLSFKERTWWAH